ncbi:unnamed protein product [Zymoseptoria tritici ST99CH_3D7]|uniref:SprT-like domain-containing protein n=2 Tax=Zymoseptoria tritici TaxID=1047171 RepID=F9WZG2_ZYMTI|nr:uncharacterized protein MYCGRDRAFT_88630 [Zymoseptoria tritici IPO323]EGP92762.1 hypothetical protein MYCGRDRAFT_88630 [Zymoseptoria tritici IPO323]SMQ44906.1 unnamed protein product [Zymoseptoria tritici ST99CH_3D7]
MSNQSTANAACPSWPLERKLKVLLALSKQEGEYDSKDARDSGSTFQLQHDDDVTKADIEWINQDRDKWDEKRRAAWDLWNDRYLPLLSEGWKACTLESLVEKEPGHRSIMEQILQCLDDIFFGGKIAAYCTFEWSDYDGNFAFTSLKNPGEVTMRVNLHGEAHGAKDVWHLVGTILHELCHVQQYVCGCQGGKLCGSCGQEKSFPHSDCFFDLSLHVETLASKLHDTEIDLGRKEAFVDRYRSSAPHATIVTIYERFKRERLDISHELVLRQESPAVPLAA